MKVYKGICMEYSYLLTSYVEITTVAADHLHTCCPQTPSDGSSPYVDLPGRKPGSDGAQSLAERALCLEMFLVRRCLKLNRMLIAGIIAFAFGDTILPEVQATVGGNAKVEMYKGISMGYSILLTSYMVVAIAGYWAFGFNVSLKPLIFLTSLSNPSSFATHVSHTLRSL